jgi:hypothetical protein
VKKRVLVMSDTHCGHVVGLTPKENQLQDGSKYADIEREMWDWYVTELDKYKPFNILIFNGDAIDGKGDRSGGTELLTTDRNKQVDMAMKVIAQTEAKDIRLVYGTPYHAGKDEDWEKVLADKLGCKVESHGFYSVNGCIFDVKHKIGSSSIPHGRFTAIAKDALWNELWSLRGMQERANIVIRSHVHYYAMAEDATKTAFITPGLQGFGSKFGARVCSGTVDIGFIVIDVEDNGEWSHDLSIKAGSTEKPQVSIL